MKKLFVIHRIDNTKKDEKQEIFHLNSKNDSQSNTPTLKLSEKQANLGNSIATTTTNYSEDSRKYSLNLLTSKPLSSFNLNTTANSNEDNKYLGKKIKIYFDSIKDDPENNINNLINELNELNNTLDEITDKNEFTKSNYKKGNKNKESKSQFNEGRWSTEENKRFIEGLVKSGKNWKEVQKCIGTRSTSQTRSHAQKFLIKLKTFKNENLNIDLTGNNIKSLNDIIEIIKTKNDNNEDEETFLINTLISLGDSISLQNERNKRNKNKNENKKTENVIINKDKNESFNNMKNILNNINFITPEIKKIEINSNNESVKSSTNIDTTKSSIYEKNLKQENSDHENLQEKKEEINFMEDENDFQTNKRLIIEDGIAFYLNNDDDYFHYNNSDYKLKEYYYNENFESNSIFNKNFFS